MLEKCRKSLIPKDMKQQNWLKRLVPFDFGIHIFGHFSLILNCHISKTIRTFDLIPTLRARPKYQLLYTYIGLHAAKSMGMHTAKS